VQNYARQLLDVFDLLEGDRERGDATAVVGLRHLWAIFKHLALCNVPQLLEHLLEPELVLRFFGTLEYDPDQTQPGRHRHYLTSESVFREVVPFRNPAVVKRIHATFRLQYLKDVVLVRGSRLFHAPQLFPRR
jgi:protein phosphatase-4 regulatory subunit 3